MVLAIVVGVLCIYRKPIVDFFRPDLTQWVTEEGKHYLLDKEGNPRTGWVEKDGQRYYLDETLGYAATGWVQTPEGSFYMKPDSAMAIGITDVDGMLCYFDDQGIPISGWVEYEGERRYFDENGCPHQGWLEYEGSTYYLLSGGIPAVGKLVIDEKNHFFTSAGVEIHNLGDITLEEYIDNLTNDGTTCGGKAPADE